MDAANIPGMNRARYRQIDSRMRKIMGRSGASCSSCAVDGDHILDKFAAGHPDGTDKYVGITVAVGVAASIPELAKVRKGTDLPAVLRRVSMLATVVAHAVFASGDSAQQRQQVLRDLTSFKACDDAMKFASRIKGSDLDRLQMGLVLVFLQGALGLRLGIADESVIGYRRALQKFDEALANLQRQKAGLSGAPESAVLAGLGALGGPVESALDWVVTKLGEMGRSATGLLCKAMEAIFTGQLQPVGGVICSIIRLTLGGLFDATRSLIAVTKILFTGLANFFAALFRPDMNAAAIALVEMVNQIVIVLLGGTFSSYIGIPIVDAELTPQQKADGVKSLEAIGKALPGMFTISLVASVLGIVFGGPTPGSISALIVTLSPAVVEILAPVLKSGQIAEKFKQMPIEEIRKGIAVVIKIGSMVVAGVMQLPDVIRKFGVAIKGFADRMIKLPDARQRFMQEFMNNFTPAWNKFMDKVKVVNLLNAVTAAKELFKFLPDLIQAIAQSDPDLADAIDATKEIVDSAKSIVVRAKEVWKQAFDEAPRPDKIRLAFEQFTESQRQLALLCASNSASPYCTDFAKVQKYLPASTKKTPPKTNDKKAPPAKGRKSKISGGIIAAVAGVAGLAVFAIARASR